MCCVYHRQHLSRSFLVEQALPLIYFVFKPTDVCLFVKTYFSNYHHSNIDGQMCKKALNWLLCVVFIVTCIHIDVLQNQESEFSMKS